MSTIRIGILGGAFDPVHHGHLLLAQEAQDALGLEKIILMPGAQTPLKGRAPAASDAHRLAMLTAAVRHRPDWEVCDWEIRQGGVSYSLNTAAYLRTRFPEAELHWIIGADQFTRLPDWHKIGELGRLVRFAVALRNGDNLKRPERLPVTVLAEALPARRIDLSSTEVRERLASGKPGAEWMIPYPVYEYIRKHGLYARTRP